MTTTTQDQAITLPHGRGLRLRTGDLVLSMESLRGGDAWVRVGEGDKMLAGRLTPAERRWLADELLHGLEDGDAE